MYVIVWKGEATPNWRGYPTSTLAHEFDNKFEAGAYIEMLAQERHWMNKEFRIVKSDRFYQKSS